MKYLLLLVFIVSCIASPAQSIIKGRVTDAETNKPVAGTSVFLTNTSNGTVAGADGQYSLKIPSGRYDVVFSAVGYETKVFSSLLADSFAFVKLQPKVRVLDDVEVGFDKDGWKNWGQFFLDNFIGTTQFSRRCKIENTEALRFRHNKKQNILTVFSDEPLIIVNNALGYTIKYKLDDFTYKFRDRRLYFEGYPLFEEMKGTERQIRRWDENRKEAYDGSQMHFMRSLFRNRLAEEGFEVHRLKKIKNAAKDSLRKLISTGNVFVNEERAKILQQPDGYDVMSNIKLTGDSIAYAIDSVTAGLAFTDYLHVLYIHKKAPAEYRSLFQKTGNGMASQVTLLEHTVLQVQANGNFFPPTVMLSLGYWAWSEKISNMLPFNYKP